MGTLILDSSSVNDFVSPVTSYITSAITKVFPGWEFIIVFIFSFFIAYLVKSKNGWGKYSFVALGLAIFGFLRYCGVGG